ncbi:SMC-Scp complex subunit ScpB [Stieleria sp. TO1_6]|uniref:SMC-Scp complex subunit ScpB n=1 Tax=Stieleria tagensis TaxID=2956795 RepID=UPI00209A8E09|nr:SMC-Scp complex subunit ScpB [Stieleria tagensis]MCO8121725.1 SMC-Scp complex subunit ScpB [Stieleria tagensis]
MFPLTSHRLAGRPAGLSPGASRQRPPVWRPYGVLIANRINDQTGTAAEDPTDGRADRRTADQENPSLRRMRTEAVLLVAKTPLTTRKLAQLAHLADGTEARTLVRQLNQIYDDLGRSVRIEKVAGGFRMLTRAAYAPWLARLGHLPAAVRLSSPMMETLAVVAYRGPVSRADVEAIRGVACGELLRQLMERDLIRIAGRSEELGRPYLYDTTKHFLQLFGLASIDALPAINWEPLQEDEEVDPEHST